MLTIWTLQKLCLCSILWRFFCVLLRFIIPEMLPIRNISYLLPMLYSFWEKCKNSPKTDLGCSTPLMKKTMIKFLSIPKFQTYTYTKTMFVRHTRIHTMQHGINERMSIITNVTTLVGVCYMKAVINKGGWLDFLLIARERYLLIKFCA